MARERDAAETMDIVAVQPFMRRTADGKTFHKPGDELTVPYSEGAALRGARRCVAAGSVRGEAAKAGKKKAPAKKAGDDA